MKLFKRIIFILFTLVFISTAYHYVMLKIEASNIIPCGKLVNVNNHHLHIYSEGDTNEKPTLVFLSGSATVAPVYDFKPLYSKLSSSYHIAVVEKFGYGYSDITDSCRDVDTMLYETRQALLEAGEKPPYVVIPHSMSGIEALYWVQKYPEEISAIIGLDMAIPSTYEYMDFKSINRNIILGRTSVICGLHRTISFLYPLYEENLNADEKAQQKYLMYKNAVNKVYISESKSILSNARLVASNQMPDINILLFVSNGDEIGDYWLPSMGEFAKKNNTEIVYLDCGHYVHYYETEFIAKKSIDYLGQLN